jgi:D-cysteine desulfhydrase
VKRDDLCGFAFGGHKTRVVEVLLADALAGGHDEIVGCGGPASNLCPTLAAGAAHAGLGCTLVLHGGRPDRVHPNLAAMERWGAEVVFTGDPDRASTDGAAHRLVAQRAQRGRHPYLVPRGGATSLGALAYAAAADELAQQLSEQDLDPETVVLPVGSGATTAGLLAALSGWSRATRLTGAVVSRPVLDTLTAVTALAAAAARLSGRPTPDERRLDLVDAIGPGFGRSTPQLEAATRLALDAEGLVVDITYGARALAVLAARCGDATGPIVFWHTGGALDAVADLLELQASG